MTTTSTMTEIVMKWIMTMTKMKITMMKMTTKLAQLYNSLGNDENDNDLHFDENVENEKKNPDYLG